MRWWILILGAGLFLILGACNPKPVEEVVKDKQDTFIMIDNPEKMYDKSPIFDEHPILQAAERLLFYYDVTFDIENLEKVTITPMYNRQSILDVFLIAMESGVALLPLKTDYETIKEAIEMGKPIYAEFTIIQNNEQKAIFYGYSDTEFSYIDLFSGEKRYIDKSRLENVSTFTSIIPYKEGELTTGDLEQSAYYLELAMSDGYFRDDKEMIKKYLTVAETNSLEDEVFVYKYLKMYYHTFYEFNPDVVKPILEMELAIIRDPGRLEIALQLAFRENDDVEMANIIKDMQITRSLRPETLQIIIDKGKTFGIDEKVRDAEQMLQQKTE